MGNVERHCGKSSKSHTKTAEEKNWKQDLNKLFISKSLNLLKIPDDFLTM